MGPVLLTDCIVDNNTSGNGGYGMGVGGDGGSGGGMVLAGPSTLQRCRISGNSAKPGRDGYSVGAGAGGSGGGIVLQDTCAIHSCQITGNTAAGNGGGIVLQDSCTINSCQITGNIAVDYGGGILVADSDATITNSTLAENSASAGGAIYVAGGGCTIVHGTVSSNESQSLGAGVLVSSSGHVTLANSLVSANRTPLVMTDIAADGGVQSIVSAGYNIVWWPGPYEAVFSEEGDATGLEPGLGPLSDNGGPTMTCALLTGSMAIDRIPSDNPWLTPLDQRGYARPSGTLGDIGAFEAGALASRPTQNTPRTAPSTPEAHSIMVTRPDTRVVGAPTASTVYDMRGRLIADAAAGEHRSIPRRPVPGVYIVKARQGR
ncbi:MAG: hypothetical protein GF331_16800 [Chitinivibrionales bacterium]|nr:hypothetical protein [Chitinivibrionales bacterium]